MAITASNGNLRIESKVFSQLEEEKAGKRKGEEKQKDMISDRPSTGCIWFSGDSQVALVVKNLPASAGGTGSIPVWGRPPREGYGNPLQYFCLENFMDIGAWQATVHGVTKSCT